MLGLTSGAVRLVAVSAWTMDMSSVSTTRVVGLVEVSAWTVGLAADAAGAGGVSEEEEVILLAGEMEVVLLAGETEVGDMEMVSVAGLVEAV